MIFWKILQQQEQEFNNIKTNFIYECPNGKSWSIYIWRPQVKSGDTTTAADFCHRSLRLYLLLLFVDTNILQLVSWGRLCVLHQWDGKTCETELLSEISSSHSTPFFSPGMSWLYSLCWPCSNVPSAQGWQMSNYQGWAKLTKCLWPKLVSHAPQFFQTHYKITNKSDVKITSSVVVDLIRKEWFYYNPFMWAMNIRIFCDISQLWIGTRGAQLKR